MIAGIAAALMTGFLWMIYGIILKRSSEKGVRGVELMFLYSLLELPFLWMQSDGAAEWGQLPWATHVLLLAVGGANAYAMLLLQKAMTNGNSAVAWAIGQSALIGPFFCGLLFWGEPWVPVRVLGGLLIPAGILLSALGQQGKKRANSRNRKYLLWTFEAFALLVFAQTVLTASSRWAVVPSGGIRGIYLALGTTVLTICLFLPLPAGRTVQRGRTLVIFALLMTAVTAVSNWTLFISLDALAQVQMSGIGYPLMLGGCIAEFALYSMFVLKEPRFRSATAGLVLIIVGIVLLSLGSAPESSGEKVPDAPAVETVLPPQS